MARAWPVLLCSAWLAAATGCPAELDSDHSGWKQADCFTSGCHPVNVHTEDRTPADCAECHGSNGAPGGHFGAGPCSHCHGVQHGGPARGFLDPDSCGACHP